MCYHEIKTSCRQPDQPLSPNVKGDRTLIPLFFFGIALDSASGSRSCNLAATSLAMSDFIVSSSNVAVVGGLGADGSVDGPAITEPPLEPCHVGDADCRGGLKYEIPAALRGFCRSALFHGTSPSSDASWVDGVPTPLLTGSVGTRLSCETWPDSCRLWCLAVNGEYSSGSRVLG